MNTQKTVEPNARDTKSSKDKQPYETPILKEHGNAKEVTLQTFFGTFSPGGPTGNS